MFILRRIKKNNEIVYILEPEDKESSLLPEDELLNAWMCESINEANFIIAAHKTQ